MLELVDLNSKLMKYGCFTFCLDRKYSSRNKESVFTPFKNSEPGVVTSPVLFCPHINQTWGHQKSAHMNQILQDDIKVCFQNGIPWAAKRGTSATSRYNNGQAQVFLPYIARCGFTEEERLDTFWGTGQNVVGSIWIGDFLVEMHFTSMCVKYSSYLLEGRLWVPWH